MSLVVPNVMPCLATGLLLNSQSICPFSYYHLFKLSRNIIFHSTAHSTHLFTYPPKQLDLLLLNILEGERSKDDNFQIFIDNVHL